MEHNYLIVYKMAKCAAMLKDIKNSTEIEMHAKLKKKNHSNNAGH